MKHASDRLPRGRWTVVAGALVIQISLGAVFIWSVFQTPLRMAFPGWTEAMVTLPAQIVLACYATTAILGGRLQDRLGPRRVAAAGGVILGAGMIMAGSAGRFGESAALAWLILTFSLIGGIGIGTAYVCPIATCLKWFPDRKGFIAGLAVAGFGAGAFFFAPLAGGLISGAPYSVLGIPLFSLPRLGVFGAFHVLGVVFLAAVVLGAQLLRNPPPGYAAPAAAAGEVVATESGCSPRGMLATPAFWILWITFVTGCASGLAIVMKASPIWQGIAFAGVPMPASGAEFQRVTSAGAAAVSILAIFNAVGRVFWGRVSDAMGRRTTLVLIFALFAAALLTLDRMQTFSLYLLGSGVVVLCFGGCLAVYPAVTAEYFGARHIGANYGCMFTALGTGGLIGPFLAARLMEAGVRVTVQPDCAGAVSLTVGRYGSAFAVAGLACAAAAVLVAFALRPPRAIRSE
jgi:OFA family oxalate/formate antiporter-like MFS transporter